MQTINKQTFYKALSGESLEQLDALLTQIGKEKASDINNAYKGGLLLKKASLKFSPFEKFNYFKEGKTILENEIIKNPNNAEFRFIRLVSQEKAPAFLGYNTNLQEDKNMIINQFKNLDLIVKVNILEYSMKSEILKPSDLK